MASKTYTIALATNDGIRVMPGLSWDEVCSHLDGSDPSSPKPLVFAGAPISVKRTYEVEGPPRKKRAPKSTPVETKEAA